MGIIFNFNLFYYFYNLVDDTMTGMRVLLKSGEYYDYFDIKRVEILDHYIVKIKGNFSKGTKSKIAQIHLQAIKNIREFNRFLRNEMKLFQADGSCEHCGGLNVEEQGQSTSYKRLNKPKEKRVYRNYVIEGYRCNSCGKRFNDLKPTDLEIYY